MNSNNNYIFTRIVFLNRIFGFLGPSPRHPALLRRVNKSSQDAIEHYCAGLWRTIVKSSEGMEFINAHFARNSISVDRQPLGQSVDWFLRSALLQGELYKTIDKVVVDPNSALNFLTHAAYSNAAHTVRVICECFVELKKNNIPAILNLESSVRAGAVSSFNETRTPLQFAVHENKAEAVEELLRFGANPNPPSSGTVWPLLIDAVAHPIPYGSSAPTEPS